MSTKRKSEEASCKKNKRLVTSNKKSVVRPVQLDPFQVKITTSNAERLYAKLVQRLPNISFFSYEWFFFVFQNYWYDEVESSLVQIDQCCATESRTLCPPLHRIWRWAELIPNPMDVRVVIVGQDPYTQVAGVDTICPTPMADGLAFSVSRDYYSRVKRLPPSLVNILRAVRKVQSGTAEMNDHDEHETDSSDDEETTTWLLDLLEHHSKRNSCCSVSSQSSSSIRKEVRNGNLEAWCRQGVLLLNNTLTAPAGTGTECANSHRRFGWQFVTDAVIRRLGSGKMPHRVFFMLWGRFAQESKLSLIRSKTTKDNGTDSTKTSQDGGTLHHVFTSHHPSPLAVNRRGEFPYSQFLLCNKLLEKDGRKQICWM